MGHGRPDEPPRGHSERARALAAGHGLSRVPTAEDLVAGDEAYFVAGARLERDHVG